MIHNLLKSLFRPAPAPPCWRRYPAQFTILRNKSELSADLIADVQFGHLDDEGEVLLATGLHHDPDDGAIAIMNQVNGSEPIGQVLRYSITGRIVSFDIRFQRRSPTGMTVKEMFYLGCRFNLELVFNSISSSPATREERKALRLSWIESSPRVHRLWEPMIIALTPRAQCQDPCQDGASN